MEHCELGLILLTSSVTHYVSLEGTYYIFAFASLFSDKTEIMILAIWFLIIHTNGGEKNVEYGAQ